MRNSRNYSLRSLACVTLTMLVCSANFMLRAADITWDAGTINTGTTWLGNTNWITDTVPTFADNAIFDGTTTNTTTTIQMATAGGLQRVGSITIAAGNIASRTIRNNSTTVSGALELNGVGGVLLANNDDNTEMILQNSSGTSQPMRVRLANSGEIYVATGGNSARIAITATIDETNGSRGFTKTGPGILYIQGTNNSFTGPVTNSAGALRFNDVGTLGTGVAPLYLTGGDIISGLDRGGAGDPPIANPVVLLADTSIYNDGGNVNSTRTIPFSGAWSGSAGTVKISNFTGNPPQTFQVRMIGGMSFSRPIVVGIFDTPTSFSVLQFANYATNGIQTFSGDISGVGAIRRTNLNSSVSAGTTILTGDNTYSGGTWIHSGTLLANNLVGSALGSGSTTVSNTGILGGNGTITAPVSVSLNGVVSPGSTSSNVANLTISDLTLGENAVYVVQVSNATGFAGSGYDTITASTSWTDAATSVNPVTIKLDSLGVTPANWNAGIAYNWTIIDSSSAIGFDVSHFAIDTASFTGTIQGVFSLSVVSGDLILTYTPAADIVINVPTGSVSQGQTSPTPYPLLTGTFGVVKIGNGECIFTNPANNYIGSTKILAGTATLPIDALNGSGAFGAAATAVQLGNTTGNSNAAISINTAGVTMSRNITVQSGSSGAKSIGTTIGSGTATYSGDILLNDSATMTVSAGGEALVSGLITGTGGIAKSSAGTATFTALNSYSGSTTLGGGAINVSGRLGTGTLTVSSATTLDNNGAASTTLVNTQVVLNANVTFTGTTNLSLGSGAVTLGGNRTITANSNNFTIGGAISGAGVGLTKQGAGRLSFTASTTNSYTGGTTNLAGLIAMNGSTTFGDGTGTLVLGGGNILNTGTRAGSPIANPVVMTANTVIYGDSTAAAPSTRIFPFSGGFTSAGSTLTVGNTGLSNNTFILRFQGSSFTTVNFPIIIGDAGFDTPGALSQLDLYNDAASPTMTVSGLVSGAGRIRRSFATLNGGGSTILTAQNTYTGGTEVNSGALGFGSSSVLSLGNVVSGPVGTAQLIIGALNDEAFITLFASGGARTIDNFVFINGATNVVFSGTNALTFAGTVNAGGVTKTLTTSNAALTTFSGEITNSAAIIKAGAGTLVLSGDNSARTNNTTVNAGTLLVNNTIGTGTGSGDVTVNSGGRLGGTGSIAGTVTVNAGGTLAPGNGLGTLMINSSLVLAGNLAVDVNQSASPSNDLASVSGTINNIGSGTVNVSNLGGALSVGDSFKLFNQAVINGGALSVTGGGVTWTNKLAVDGSIQVLSTGGNVPPSFPPGSVAILPSGNISLTATGALGTSYRLWATTNVALTPVTNTWTLLNIGTITVSPFTINDLGATNFPQRFYLFSTP